MPWPQNGALASVAQDDVGHFSGGYGHSVIISRNVSIRNYQTLLAEWQSSETACLSAFQSSTRWMRGFFSESKRLFRVAITDGETLSDADLLPNAATSVVVVALDDIKRLAPYDWELDETWPAFQVEGTDALASIENAQLADVLPLRSFGVLPAFSTAYLAQALGIGAKPIDRRQYVLAIRALIAAIYRHHGRRDRPSDGRTDDLHPFLLFQIGRALKLLEEHVKTVDASVQSFFLEIQDAKKLKDDLISLGARHDAAERALEADDPQFADLLASVFTPAGVDLRRILNWLEDAALTDSIQELVNSRSTRKDTIDSAALGFGLLTLDLIDRDKHQAIIRDGVETLAGCSEAGLFPSTLPFNIDEKGRALFAATIEIANAVLSLALNTSDEQLVQRVIEGTTVLQDRLREKVGRVSATATSGVRTVYQGWCSDRAPSQARLDSWITVQALAFFARRLALVRRAKRTLILGNYSSVSWNVCRPKWDEVVDPNLGEATELKKSLLDLAQAPVSEREKAPVFLLFGPPGTSKSSVAQALASYLQWDLVLLSPSDFVSDSLDRIEQRARQIFQDLMNLDGCVVLMDEMDSILRDREAVRTKGAGTIIEFVVPALLPKLQQLRDYCLKHRMAIFYATNYYETVDAAIRRSGRMDAHVPVLPYTSGASKELVNRFAKKLNMKATETNSLLATISDLPNNLTYRDIEDLARASQKLSEPDLLKLGRSLGVSAILYEPSRGIATLPEFFAILDRLVGDKQLPWEEYARIARADAIANLSVRLPKLYAHREWAECAKKWLSVLTTAP